MLGENIMNNTCNYQSESRFLLPFYYENCNVGVSESPFEKEDFVLYEIKTKYLVKAIGELFSGNEKATCRCYYIKDEARRKYNLPARFTSVKVHSKMRGCSGNYSFKILGNRVFYFPTGIGYLETSIQYENNDPKEIANIGFYLANVFTNEHDSGQIENNLSFSYEMGEQEILFSFKNSFYSILQAEKHKDNLVVFPATERKRMQVYHSVICKNVLDEKKNLYSLCNGLHYDIYYDENMDDDLVFSSVSNQKWAVSSSGVVSLAVINEDDAHSYFLANNFMRSTLYDYYYIFILLLHERELLLRYNHLAVKNKSQTRKFIGMKKNLLQLEILYTYNTVSTEASYQKFFNNLEDAFNISKLEDDIHEVIENVEAYVKDRKDRRTNTLLTAISVLAVFSVLTDGIALADRIQSGAPFGVFQWMVIAIVAIFISVAIIMLRRK